MCMPFSCSNLPKEVQLEKFMAENAEPQLQAYTKWSGSHQVKSCAINRPSNNGLQALDLRLCEADFVKPLHIVSNVSNVSWMVLGQAGANVPQFSVPPPAFLDSHFGVGLLHFLNRLASLERRICKRH